MRQYPFINQLVKNQMFKNQTLKVVLVTTIICSIMLVNGYLLKEQYKGSVKINYTKSGWFIITNNRIYSVSELQTDDVKGPTLSAD